MKVKVTFSTNPDRLVEFDDDDRLCKLLLELNGGGLSEAQIIKARSDLGAIQNGEAVRLNDKHLGGITIERSHEKRNKIMTNINPETGIRYGCVYLNSLDPDTAAWLWDDAENLSEAEAYAELKSEIEAQVMEECPDLDESEIEIEVEKLLDCAAQDIEIDEPTLAGTCEGVRYEISWLGGAPLLWVLESPVISKARLCSPCCPNAGDLNSLDDDGYECYGIPADWYAKD